MPQQDNSALPAGYTLDAPTQSAGLPAGYTLDPPESSSPTNALTKASSVSAQPKPFTMPWVKQNLWRAGAAIADAAPAIGATVGGMIGAPEGPVASVAGAGIGGMGGAAAQQLMRRGLGYQGAFTSADAAKDIAKQGVLQGAIQAGSELLPPLAGPLKSAAESQYERALAPGGKFDKDLAQAITPQLIQRREFGSLNYLENRAGARVQELNPQLDAAYAKATTENARPPVRGLLPAAPTAIPLAPNPEPGDMPMGFFDAPQFPRSAVSSGEPSAQLQRELGPAANTIPARIYRPAYMSTNRFGDVVGDVEQPTAGVMQSRDPRVINQVYPQTGAPYPSLPQSSVKGAGGTIINDLETLKNKYVVDGKSASPAAVSAINGVQDIVRQYGPDISPNSLRKLKGIFDDPVAKAGGFAGADLSTRYTLQAQKAAADSIRGIMAQASPDVAALNKEISFWLNVQKVTSESGLRKTGQEGLTRALYPLVAGAAASTTGLHFGSAQGLAAGAATTLAVAAGQIIRSPEWRTMSAVAKDQLANALARGDVGAVSALGTRLGVAGLQSSQKTAGSIPGSQLQTGRQGSQ